jgi:branched-chain amino acid transport system permease protein
MVDNIQISFNIFYLFSLYYLLSVSFKIIFSLTKFYNITHAAIIALGPYFTDFFLNIVPFFISVLFAILCSILISILIEKFIYKPLRDYKCPSHILLIASLGLYIVLQNIISIIWGEDPLILRIYGAEIRYEIVKGAYLTKIQIIQIVTCIILFISYIILYYSRFGVKIYAVASDEKLARIFGIDSKKIILWIFCIGSGLAAIAGILITFDTFAKPSMGFTPLLYCIIIMILGNMINENWGLIIAVLIFVILQNLDVILKIVTDVEVDHIWNDTIMYLILLLVLWIKSFDLTKNKGKILSHIRK